MKKIFTILLAVIMASALLAGCQATPKEPVVINKDTEQLIEKAVDNEDNLTLTQMLNAPERLELSATDGSGTVTVNADAEIIVPDAEGVSTTRVKKRDFTQEEADRIVEYFIGDNEFNTRYEAGYDDMVEMLMQFKTELAKETDPEKRAQLEQSIEKFESAGIIIPDEPQEVTSASKMFGQRAEGGEHIAGYARDGDNNCFLSIVNNIAENENIVLYTKEQKGFATHEGLYWYEWQKAGVEKMGLDPNVVGQMSLSITQEEAQKTAQDTLTALGIEDMKLAVCEEVWGGISLEGGITDLQGRHAYQLKYVRVVSGIPITYTDNEASEDYVEDEGTPNEQVIAGWPYEDVHFIIDDTGIVEFVWESPYEIVETVTEHSAVKPFEEISNVFSKMMLITNAYPGEDVTQTFNILRAELGLMRIMEKNNPDTALLIPVWDFFGDVTHDYTDGNGKKQADTIHDMYTSHLTINAIDGSVIDRRLGY
jgi:uncharacterized protein YcfL